MASEVLTIEEAEAIELSSRPIERQRQLRQYLGAMGMDTTFPLIKRRKHLVDAAEAIEESNLEE